MFKMKFFPVPALLAVLILFSCATDDRAAKEAAAAEATAAATGAVGGMGGVPPVGAAPAPNVPASLAPAGVAPDLPAGAPASAAPRARPAWVDRPEAVYAKLNYVSAVGYGRTREEADRSALTNLTAVFGQSIKAEISTITKYNELRGNGALDKYDTGSSGPASSGESSSGSTDITVKTAMDSLIGAEIADRWEDASAHVIYSIAVMDRDKTAALYADMIRGNERIIADLVKMTDDEKNSLDGYARLRAAATVADANRVYANVLSVVGNTTGIKPDEIKTGDSYRLEAANVAKKTVISVNVQGDSGNRVKNAFVAAITRAGFITAATGARYVLNVNITMTPTVLPAQQNKFVRYNIQADLADTRNGGIVLIPYNAQGREGHLTESEAENRAFRSAEQKITEEYAKVLSDHLESLLGR